MELIGAIPDLPSQTAFQVSEVLLPRAQITPRPVTATRRALMVDHQAWHSRGKRSLPDSAAHGFCRPASCGSRHVLDLLQSLRIGLACRSYMQSVVSASVEDYGSVCACMLGRHAEGEVSGVAYIRHRQVAIVVRG